MKYPFDSIIFINLKRREDKLNRLTERLQKLNLPKEIKIIRIDAIDGTSIDDQWLEENDYHPHPDYYDSIRNRGLTYGEIGCAISHLKAWETITNDPSINCSLILEDDVTFPVNFSEKVQKIDSYNLDWELFYLGRKKIQQEPEVNVIDDVVEPLFSYWCLAYMVTKSGAKKLTESDFKSSIIPADEFVPIMVGTPNTKCLQYTKKYKIDTLKPLALKDNFIMPENWAFMGSETERTQVYFKNNFYDDGVDKFILLTVATEENDRLERFKKSCEHFGVPYKILGLGKEWNGGDAENGVLKSFGGGQKVNLLREELESWEKLSDHIILFTDSYDVIVLNNPQEILNRFRQFNRPILFSAEKTCWPDPNLDSSYKESNTEYKYLNSGGFIGYADKILELISDPIQDHEDDQLYYTKKYLSSLKQREPFVKKGSIPINTYPKSIAGSKFGWMSEPVFDEEVFTYLKSNFSSDTKILDIGAGDGKWGFILKKYFENVDAVEIFEPYIERYGLEKIYSKVINQDFLTLDLSDYDIVIMGDVFEHVTRNEAKNWLKKNSKKLKEIIVVVPFEYPQDWDGVYENKWGHHHQPDLTPELFSIEYPELILVAKIESPDSANKGKGFGLFVKNYHTYHSTIIHLDTNQFIFQTLNEATNDIEVDMIGKVKNKVTNSYPQIIHGNGPKKSKDFLDTISNFVSVNYDTVYGFKFNNQQTTEKKLMIGLFILSQSEKVEQFLDQFNILDYPKQLIDLKIYFNDDKSLYQIYRFEKNNPEFSSVEIVKCTSNTDSRIDFLSLQSDSDFRVMMDCNYILRNPKSLSILTNENTKIISPMIVAETKDFSNFHLNDQGNKKLYLNYETKGIWTVDFITGVVLIRKDFITQVIESLSKDGNYQDGDWDLKMCDNLRKENYFLYICNSNYFGTLI